MGGSLLQTAGNNWQSLAEIKWTSCRFCYGCLWNTGWPVGGEGGVIPASHWCFVIKNPEEEKQWIFG